MLILVPLGSVPFGLGHNVGRTQEEFGHERRSLLGARRFTTLGRLEWQSVDALDFMFQIYDSSGKRKATADKRSHRYLGRKIAIGVFYSAKSGLTFRYDSALEKTWFSILEGDPAVKHFLRTPVGIPYVYQGEPHIYKPDILVEYIDGRKFLVEIKHPATVDDPKNMSKHEAAAKWCLQAGMPFMVWTFPDRPPITF